MVVFLFKNQRWFLEMLAKITMDFRHRMHSCSGVGNWRGTKKEQRQQNAESLLRSPQAWGLNRIHNMQASLYSQLNFVIVKRWKPKLAIGRGLCSKIQQKLGISYQGLIPDGVLQNIEVPSTTGCGNTHGVLSPRKLLENQCQRFYKMTTTLGFAGESE